ncbi:MAG: tetratricopeptide repeat protein [Thermodesulfobacteriota bacterium]
MDIRRRTEQWLLLAGCLLLLGQTACAPLAGPDGEGLAQSSEETGRVATGSGAERGCGYLHFLRGKGAELAGRADEAIDAYRQALECDPKASHVMRTLATLLIKSGRRDEAVQWVNRLVSLNPQDTLARALLATLYSALDRQEEAIALYQAILNDDPKNFNVLLLLGGLHARLHDYPNAKQVLERLVELNPDSYAGHYYLAKLYQEMRLLDQAAASFDKALALNWSTELALEAAELREQAGQDDQTEKLYRRILAEEAVEERARSGLVNLYLRRGKTEQALRELEELRAITAEPMRVELAIGRLLLDKGRAKEAIRRLTPLLKKGTAVEGVRALLVLAHYQNRDTASAKKLLRQVKPGETGYNESILMLARILQEDKDVAGAEKVLLAAIADEQHRRLSFYAALAGIHAGSGKPDKAHAVFQRAFADFPGSAEPHYEYALLLHKLDDTAGAMREMEEVLRLDPHHAHALNYVGYSWAEEGKNLEQALAYIEEAVAKLPKDGFVRDSLGWVYYRLGRFPEAVRELEQAVALSAEDPTILEHLGDASLKAGEPGKAADAYRRALEAQEEAKKKDELRRKLEAIPAQAGQGGGK